MGYADSANSGTPVTNLTAGDIIQSELAGAGNRIANAAVGVANLLIAMSPGDAELIDPVHPFTPKSNYFGQRGEATADGLMAVNGATALGKGIAGAVEGATNTMRVGRWMSQAEYQAMREGGRMQEGAGGATFVATSGPGSFAKQAPSGSVYVEFNVPRSSLLQGGQADWFKVVGPNASKSMRFMLEKQGGEMLPPVRNMSRILETKQ